jgi:hypothetical protein
MIDIILLLMVIASAISLVVVCPRDLRKRAVSALREHEEMQLSRTDGRGEHGEASKIPANLICASSHLATDWPEL